ncbi:UNVERIFIED_CONTAM: hypothetical protein K2H54_028899 [Gekko kuhli]
MFCSGSEGYGMNTEQTWHEIFQGRFLFNWIHLQKKKKTNPNNNKTIAGLAPYQLASRQGDKSKELYPKAFLWAGKNKHLIAKRKACLCLLSLAGESNVYIHQDTNGLLLQTLGNLDRIQSILST